MDATHVDCQTRRPCPPAWQGLGGVERRLYGLHGQAQQLLTAVAQAVARLLVHVDDRGIQVADEDRVPGLLDQVPETFLALAQCRVSPLLLRDVPRDGRQADRFARRRVAHVEHVQTDRDHLLCLEVAKAEITLPVARLAQSREHRFRDERLVLGAKMIENRRLSRLL